MGGLCKLTPSGYNRHSSAAAQTHTLALENKLISAIGGLLFRSDTEKFYRHGYAHMIICNMFTTVHINKILFPHLDVHVKLSDLLTSTNISM